MANSDYSAVASGTFCPVASVTSAVSPLQTQIPLYNFKHVDDGDVKVGQACLLGDEVLAIEAVSDTMLTVKRGCYDTIPAQHAGGATVWFFDGFAASDYREYIGTEAVGLKILPRTPAGATPITHAPPVPLTFAMRFARPYPPAMLLGNGQPWYTPQTIQSSVPLSLTWVNRNRVSQQDQLVGHSEGNMTPEVGTSYTIRLFTSGDTLVRTVTDLVGSFTYSQASAISDYGLGVFANTGLYGAYMTLTTVRDGHEAWQAYRIDFNVNTDGISGTAPNSKLLAEDGTYLLAEDGTKLILE